MVPANCDRYPKKTLSVFLWQFQVCFPLPHVFFSAMLQKQLEDDVFFFCHMYHSKWIVLCYVFLLVLIISLGSKYVTFPQHATAPVSGFGFFSWSQGGWPLEQCNVVAPWRSDKHNLDLGGGNSNWVVVSNFYFQPYLGRIPILTNIFQRSWNHQLANIFWISSIPWEMIQFDEHMFQYFSDGRFNHQLDTAGGSEILIRVCSSLVSLNRPY